MAANNVESIKGVFVGQELRKVRVDDIEVNEEWNSRKTYSGIEELSEDIQEHGLISPLTIRANEKGAKQPWFLVAGFRRIKAIDMIGMVEVEVKVDPSNDVENRVVNLKENLSRESVDVWELGRACKQICDRYRMTGAELEKKLAYSRNHINFAIKLYTLPKEILRAVEGGLKPPQGVLRQMLYQCDDDANKQLDLWNAWVASQTGEGGSTGGIAAPKKPSKGAIVDCLADAKEWSKIDPDKYHPDYLKGLKAGLGWVLGTRKTAPIAKTPEIDDEEEEGDEE